MKDLSVGVITLTLNPFRDLVCPKGILVAPSFVAYGFRRESPSYKPQEFLLPRISMTGALFLTRQFSYKIRLTGGVHGLTVLVF